MGGDGEISKTIIFYENENIFLESRVDEITETRHNLTAP